MQINLPVLKIITSIKGQYWPPSEQIYIYIFCTLIQVIIKYKMKYLSGPLGEKHLRSYFSLSCNLYNSISLPYFVKDGFILLIAFQICTSAPPSHWVKADTHGCFSRFSPRLIILSFSAKSLNRRYNSFMDA